jgi:hypothetical protein
MSDLKTLWLVEILLPIAYNDGAPIPGSVLEEIRGDLVDRFGGLTAFTRNPAEGIWMSGDVAHRDDVVVLEIMVEDMDRRWWKAWRSRAEELLRQDEIVVRARPIERL